MINNTGKQRRVSESEREACREGVREVRLGRGGVSEREIDMNMHYKQLKRAAIFSAGPRATNGLHEERCRSAGSVAGERRARERGRGNSATGGLCKQTNRCRFILVQCAVQNCSGMRGQSVRERQRQRQSSSRGSGGRGAKVATAAQTQRGRDGIDAPVKNARFQRGN